MANLFLLKGNKALPLESLPFTGKDKERGLQELIELHPELLPAKEMGARKFFVIGYESQAIDLLLIDEAGMVTVVETKLASNPEIAREVIGQGLEYAAKLVAGATAQSLADDAREYWRDRRQGDFDQAFQEAFGDATNALWELAEQRLSRGEVRVVIVADQIPPELHLVVEMLEDKFDFHVVEVSRTRAPNQVVVSVQGDGPDRRNIAADQANIKKWLLESLHVCAVHLRCWKHGDTVYVGAKLIEEAKPRRKRLQPMTRDEFLERMPSWARGVFAELVSYWEKDCRQSIYFESMCAVLRATLGGKAVSVGYLTPFAEPPEIQLYVRGSPRLDEKWAKDFQAVAEELHLGAWTKTRMTLKIPVSQDFAPQNVDAVKRVLGIFTKNTSRQK